MNLNESQVSELNCLPIEILQYIYNYLPVEVQSFTMPKVSRIWYAISEDNQSFQKLAKEYLSFSNSQQFNLTLELAKKYNLISMIKQENHGCRVGGYSCANLQTPITSKNEDFKNLHFQATLESYDGYSDFFMISWNPNNLKLSSKSDSCGDFRSSYAIKIDSLKLSYKDKMFFYNFNLIAYNGYLFEKKERFSWKEVKGKDIKPSNMESLIKNTLDLQLKFYNRYMVNLNMIAFSAIKKIEDFDKVVCFCDQNGRIISIKNEDDFPEWDKSKYTFRIKKRIIEGIPILICQSNSNKQPVYAKINDLFRWSIFSSTTQKLAEKLNVGINWKDY